MNSPSKRKFGPFPDWRMAGCRYHPLGMAMRRRFGINVWKISVDAGFSCPNVDGRIAYGGCVFCNTHSYAPGRYAGINRTETSNPPDFLTVQEQIDRGVEQLKRRHSKAGKFIAYFQPSTNTYGPVDYLETVYREAISHPDVIGLAIGTRPDMLPDPVLDLLESLSQDCFIQLELGLQSIHAKSLEFLHRGHDANCFFDAYDRARKRRLSICVHLILGLPCENLQLEQETAEAMARLKPDGLKLHHLHVVRETKLAELWQQGKLQLPNVQEYARHVVAFLRRIPAQVVIERISGETDEPYLLAPAWTAVKHAARNAVDQEFRKQNAWQGDQCSEK